MPREIAPGIPWPEGEETKVEFGVEAVKTLYKMEIYCASMTRENPIAGKPNQRYYITCKNIEDINHIMQGNVKKEFQEKFGIGELQQDSDAEQVLSRVMAIQKTESNQRISFTYPEYKAVCNYIHSYNKALAETITQNKKYSTPCLIYFDDNGLIKAKSIPLPQVHGTMSLKKSRTDSIVGDGSASPPAFTSFPSKG